MSLRELQNYVFISKYANWNESKKRRETWKESVERVKGMMLRKYPHVAEEIEWAYDLLRKDHVYGSQRALQFGGKPIEKINERMYNCVSSYCDRPRFFQECLFLLLCGCGTGFSVQKHHIAKLPKLNYRSRGTKTFVVPDSIEGWADALGILISSYIKNPAEAPFPEYVGHVVEFDFSLVRPAGSRLGSCLGKAPGPEPLKKALMQSERVLDVATDTRGYLKPIEAYDIIMYAADAVVSGGVRRSATICIFSKDDEDMLSAKTGNWREENPQRGRSNNSVILLRGTTTLEEFRAIVEHTKEYGEPGFIWADDLEALFNPCVEIGFYAYNEAGLSGWQGCNLSGVNWGKINTREEFLDACRAAAYIGTWQAGFTDFKYLGKVSEEIFRREALLGVSMTGIMEKPELALDPSLQRQGAETVMAANEFMCKKIGINPAARNTCLKPEGSNSARLGTSSGIHTHPWKRFIRHVQANLLETPYQLMAEINPKACELSVWSTNGTDAVIKFVVEVPDGSKLRSQMPALELLEAVKSTQINWVMAGKDVDRCTKPWLSNNVSNTITVKDEEWDDVTRYIFSNREYFTAVSLLAYCGDKDYPQAPFTSVLTAREIVSEYGDGSVFASGLIDDALRYFDNKLWDACDTVLGISGLAKEIDDQWEHNRPIFNEAEGTINYLNRKRLWIERAKKFAERYFDGDIKQMTYCLKDVYNWKIYSDLKREFKHVDYTLLQETEDNTNVIADAACAGGKCEINW